MIITFLKNTRDYDGGEYGISFISKYPLEKYILMNCHRKAWKKTAYCCGTF